ncbi:alpha/beta family hydrolase [Enterococcus hermanniensis]|uniref:Alpha/beta hydrolase fold-5 domain-containing protein n=1 Tax=Enterococcus hermanniensis TaxID=249189 RepID=A0A1L8TPK6_9ENTE|nr:alpha/beta family hydrolase [Enterococcus hermanniensis]OJG46108.1 hypothetical protein RV04_GL001274 [Enterococcus hermanniensis]
MKKWKKILLGILVGIIGILLGGIFYLHTQMYSASDHAQKSAEQASVTNDWLYFSTKNKDNPIIIFYPGALVDPASYSVWAEEVAQAGYPVYVMKMPLDLAVLSPNSGQKVLDENSNRSYIIGGHSLGGVMASRFASEHSEKLKGVFFLASYPDKKGSLKTSDLPVLSLTGSNDQVLDQTSYQEAKVYLPKATEYKKIAGGNHAGFGAYGKQKGDGKSEINNQNQQVAADLIEWLLTIR